MENGSTVLSTGRFQANKISTAEVSNYIATVEPAEELYLTTITALLFNYISHLQAMKTAIRHVNVYGGHITNVKPGSVAMGC